MNLWRRLREHRTKKVQERVRSQPDLAEARQANRDIERRILELELNLQDDIMRRRRRSAGDYLGPERRRPT